jgi:alcohol dehydrogenase (cytochrome c)
LRRPWSCACSWQAIRATAADVTYERLLKPEPHNWLMNHRDFAATRFSPLETINKSNVRELLFSVAIGGSAGIRPAGDAAGRRRVHVYLRPLGAVYKIDVRSGKQAASWVENGSGQEKLDRNRGVALWATW